MGDRDILGRVVLRMIGHDVMLSVGTLVVWAGVLGAVDWRVGLPLTLIRTAAWIGQTRGALEPVRAWQRLGPEVVDDQKLLEADDVLGGFTHRFLRFYVVGWVLSMGAALALGAMGIPAAVPTGLAERLLAVFLLGLLGGAELIAALSLVEIAIRDLRVELATRLVARRLQTRRRQTSIGSRLTLNFAAFGVIVATLMASVGGALRVRQLRSEALEHQRRLAEVGALRVELGESGEFGQLGPGLELVDADALPGELEAEPDSALRTRIDPAGARVAAAAPVGDGRWVLATAEPDEELGLLFGFIFGLMVALSTMLAVLARRIARFVTNPLVLLDASTARVVDAGDLHELDRVVTLNNDEVGRLAAQFNRLLDLLDSLATTAKAVAAGNLRVNLEHPGDLHEAFRGMLAQLREVVIEIRTTSVELASAASEIQAATREQQAAAEQQAERMGDISERVSSLSTAAVDITGAVTSVLDNAQEAAQMTETMATSIAALGRETSGIGELLEAIREVADRSDILALNGSLEATRAGEAGRGFALVADEMRRLAERINVTVGDVHDRVTTIEQARTHTIGATNKVLVLALSTADAARAISTVILHQSEDTQEASEAVREVAEAVAAGAVATSQTRASAEGLRQRAHELEEITRRFET